MIFSIEISDDELKAVLTAHAKSSFAAPAYRGDEGGKGWSTLKRAVDHQLTTVDYGPLIRERVGVLLKGILDSVLETEIRAYLKSKAKEMKKEGTLFDGVKKGDKAR